MCAFYRNDQTLNFRIESNKIQFNSTKKKHFEKIKRFVIVNVAILILMYINKMNWRPWESESNQCILKLQQYHTKNLVSNSKKKFPKCECRHMGQSENFSAISIKIQSLVHTQIFWQRRKAPIIFTEFKICCLFPLFEIRKFLFRIDDMGADFNHLWRYITLLCAYNVQLLGITASQAWRYWHASIYTIGRFGVWSHFKW